MTYVAQEIDYTRAVNIVDAYIKRTNWEWSGYVDSTTMKLKTFDEELGQYHVCIETCFDVHSELDLRIANFIESKKLLGDKGAINPYHEYIIGNDGRITLYFNQRSKTAKLEVLDCSYYEIQDEAFEDFEAVYDLTNEHIGYVIDTTNLAFIRDFVEYVLK